MKMFSDNLYLTDGGLETTLLFDMGIELRHFAAFELLTKESGRSALRDYYGRYLDLAVQINAPFVLETPTWRINPDWAYRLGYTIEEMYAMSKESVSFMREIAADYTTVRCIVSGNFGPRGDGYVAGLKMDATEAAKYHSEQARAFAHADADILTALTMTYTEEAVGIVRAAREFSLPVVISFTLETDGRLPSGESLEDAINRTDRETDGYAEHFMINCAHPSHFMNLFDKSAEWHSRIRGIRANASCKSHAELDNATELDRGNPGKLGEEYLQLLENLPGLCVFGGCCGTDHSHIQAIAGKVQQFAL